MELPSWMAHVSVCGGREGGNHSILHHLMPEPLTQLASKFHPLYELWDEFFPNPRKWDYLLTHLHYFSLTRLYVPCFLRALYEVTLP